MILIFRDFTCETILLNNHNTAAILSILFATEKVRYISASAALHCNSVLYTLNLAIVHNERKTILS